MISFEPTAIEDVILVKPVIHRDDRGFFLETYHQSKYQSGGITPSFVQDNHSKSTYGTLRGLHGQRENPQGKLVRAVEGEIFDVAVDIRPESPTFKHWVGARLSADNCHQLWVPAGLAHGFCVLTEVAQVEYKCTALYDADDEFSIAWNDPELAIDWPIENPLLSARDRAAQSLRDLLS